MTLPLARHFCSSNRVQIACDAFLQIIAGATTPDAISSPALGLGQAGGGAGGHHLGLPWRWSFQLVVDDV